MYVMDFKEYIVQRIEEMPLVSLATEEKRWGSLHRFYKSG